MAMDGLKWLGRGLSSTSYRAALLSSIATGVLSLALTLPSQVLRLGELPPILVDARDYDHLALNLARGRGFSYCWSDPEWRAPYQAAENRRDYAMHLALQGSCIPTARRAPGYPAALAVVYRIWGRSFQAGRLLGAVALALALALGSFLAVRTAGVVAAALFALCVLDDDKLSRLIGAYMSEPTTALVVMVMLAAHVALLREPTGRAGLLAGSSLGLLVLVRHFYFPLWAFGILAAAIVAARSRALRVPWLAYGGGALLVFAPWGVRNCLVLDALMPLGTQGGYALAGKYAEDDMSRSSWDSGRVARLWARRQGEPGTSYGRLDRRLRTSLTMDRDLARLGQQAAREWLLRNWRRMPAVALASLRAHARGYGALGLAAVVFAVAALALPETRRVAALALAVMAVTALTVSLTYEAHGRFATPVRPAAYLAGSLGLVALLSRAARLLRR